jgi:uncharacterized protein (UPF0332 family)
MAFDWDEYLTAAKEQANGSGEATYRSAISRAYYAAYWKARKRLERDGHRFASERNKHEAVWNLFYVEPSSTGSTSGDEGNSLRVQRTIADYQDRRRVTYNDALVAIRSAEIIMHDVSALRD